MAVRFDSFSLNELVAKPDDAFRLCSLAMVGGQRVQGYSGDYFRMYLGDTMVVIRTMLDTDRVDVLSSDFHLYRAGLIAKEAGFDPTLISAKTEPLSLLAPWFFREIVVLIAHLFS